MGPLLLYDNKYSIIIVLTECLQLLSIPAVTLVLNITPQNVTSSVQLQYTAN